jgi:hypothetical protein
MMIEPRTLLTVVTLLFLFSQPCSKLSFGRSGFGIRRLALSENRNQQEEQPPVFGEDIDAKRPIDVDIHLPAAQDPAQPLVAEGEDATAGAWTLRNDDMDATTDEIIRSRLQNGTDLNAAEATPDLSINGAVPMKTIWLRWMCTIRLA